MARTWYIATSTTNITTLASVQTTILKLHNYDNITNTVSMINVGVWVIRTILTNILCCIMLCN